MEKRFWSKVSKEDENGCMNWLGSCNHNGYGKYSNTSSHRMAYKLTQGTIPEGMHILHKCDNRKCCNPEHLSVGTQQDNMNDKVNKKRQVIGSDINTSKLSKEQVLEILNNTDKSQRQLAKIYNVSQTAIGLIKRRKNWKYI